MAYYRDLRDYVAKLDQMGLVRRISSPINKDTELMPLVRLQFRGLPPEQRTAWVFDNIHDVHGRHYKG